MCEPIQFLPVSITDTDECFNVTIFKRKICFEKNEWDVVSGGRNHEHGVLFSSVNYILKGVSSKVRLSLPFSYLSTMP
jgi:hypothetical protein